jgi:hypothetical protein
MSKKVYVEAQLVVELDDDGKFVGYILDGGKPREVSHDGDWGGELTDEECDEVSRVFTALKNQDNLNGL